MFSNFFKTKSMFFLQNNKMPTENLDSLAKVPPSHKVDIVFKRCFNDHFRYFLLKVCVYVMTVLKVMTENKTLKFKILSTFYT